MQVLFLQFYIQGAHISFLVLTENAVLTMRALAIEIGLAMTVLKVSLSTNKCN